MHLLSAYIPLRKRMLGFKGSKMYQNLLNVMARSCRSGYGGDDLIYVSNLRMAYSSQDNDRRWEVRAHVSADVTYRSKHFEARNLVEAGERK